MKMKPIRLIVPGCLVLLAGCSLSSTYLRPELPAGPHWSTAAAGGAAQASNDHWWLAFGDANLDKLVSDVIGRNNEVLIAAANAYPARLQADIAAHALLPKLDGQVGGSTSQSLNDKVASSSWSASTSVSYEIDLWGKLAAKRDKADFEASATAEDYENARLLAIAGTVDAYFTIAHANQSLASAETSLDHAKQTRALVRAQVAAGAVSYLDLKQAEQKVEELAAAVSTRKQERLVLRNALVGLLNGASNPVPEPQRLPSKKLPPIQAGLPADLLARRPDLRAAEARLRAMLKNVDETRASFYPAISLTGTLGTGGEQLLAFISNPVARLGANAALSFLNFKDMKLQVAVSRAQYEKEVLRFRATLLTAFSEVANSLGARADYAERVQRLHNVLAAAQEIEQLHETRYRSGAIRLTTWLEAQEGRRAAETALADARLAQLLNESKLYRILGGSAARSGPDGRSTKK
ncbi:efflux transporter outer membrane subunit [Mesorhizobium sp. M5C.F.Ca.IN.020.29.1.1]|nr:efflux transporter outer membrane subunit [Mesorhizobium sp. M5C.F.Ca.IN.020.29.1.1]TIO64497.1 MAG: efflux transporter outer membrane subunit [Mesorhizobium sp.]